MRAARILLALAMPLSGVAARLDAQVSIDDRARGVVAYRAMDYERSISMLRPYLDRQGSALRREERAELLGYIAAAEHWLGRPDAAKADFQAALRASVRFRPDTLDFPQVVIAVFERARESTDYLEAVLLDEAAFVQGRGSARFRIFASAVRRHRITLCDASGARLRTLHDGAIVDSITVRWDGRADADLAPGVRRIGICGGAVDAQSRELLALQLTTERRALPGVAVPATAVPSRRMAWLGPLAGAIVVGALPSLVSDAESGTPARWGVSAALVAVAIGDATRGRSTGRGPPQKPEETTIAIRAVPAAIAGAPDAS